MHDTTTSPEALYGDENSQASNARPQLLQSDGPANPEIGTRRAGSDKSGNRGGAPLGNSNATTSGLRGSKLPPGCRGEEAKLNGLRRLLRAHVAKDGKVTPDQELTIQAIWRHEMAALMAMRWLRLESDAQPASDGQESRPAMPIETRLNLLATIAKATEARDKAIARLLPGGNAGPRNDFETIYRRGEE